MVWDLYQVQVVLARLNSLQDVLDDFEGRFFPISSLQVHVSQIQAPGPLGVFGLKVVVGEATFDRNVLLGVFGSGIEHEGIAVGTARQGVVDAFEDFQVFFVLDPSEPEFG